jgi:hypothetical protein
VYNALVQRIAILLAAAVCASAADIRVGIIGTDTSHVPAFTQLLNGDPASPDHIAGARVLAAYKGGSPDVESSAGRVDQYAEQIHSKFGVEIVPDIPTLLSKVDVVLLTSVDGRTHLEQARLVIAAHKPLFIDKPLASTLADALEIARLAKAANVAWFSASSLRFGEIAQEAAKVTGIRGAITFGPSPFEPHHALDLSWYGIHAVELLFTIMGPGCQSVTRVASADSDAIACRWKDGRIGEVRGIRPYSQYGAVLFREKDVVEIEPQTAGSYRPLLVEIVKFFQTGKPPFPNEETLEIFAFMDAAQRSKQQGGGPVAMPATPHAR